MHGQLLWVARDSGSETLNSPDLCTYYRPQGECGENVGSCKSLLGKSPVDLFFYPTLKFLPTKLSNCWGRLTAGNLGLSSPSSVSHSLCDLSGMSDGDNSATNGLKSWTEAASSIPDPTESRVVSCFPSIYLLESMLVVVTVNPTWPPGRES